MRTLLGRGTGSTGGIDDGFRLCRTYPTHTSNDGSHQPPKRRVNWAAPADGRRQESSQLGPQERQAERRPRLCTYQAHTPATRVGRAKRCRQGRAVARKHAYLEQAHK